jgi:hypothetical protein
MSSRWTRQLRARTLDHWNRPTRLPDPNVGGRLAFTIRPQHRLAVDDASVELIRLDGGGSFHWTGVGHIAPDWNSDQAIQVTSTKYRPPRSVANALSPPDLESGQARSADGTAAWKHEGKRRSTKLIVFHLAPCATTVA